SEPVLVVYSLWVPFTHVYQRFAVAPRVALTSEDAGCGKSTLLELARFLTFRPNQEALARISTLCAHLDGGPGTVLIDEWDHATKEVRLGLQEIWDVGHKKIGAKKSLLIGGLSKVWDLYCPMMCAGIRLLHNFGPQQLSRTHRLEMRQYTPETKPPLDFYIEGDIDMPALNGTYSLIRKWAATAELNPRPQIPGVI